MSGRSPASGNVMLQRSTTKSRKQSRTVVSRGFSRTHSTNSSDSVVSDDSSIDDNEIEMSSPMHDNGGGAPSLPNTQTPNRQTSASNSVSSAPLSVASSCDSDAIAVLDAAGGISEPLLPPQPAEMHAKSPSSGGALTPSPTSKRQRRRFRQTRFVRYQQQIRIWFDQILISLDSPSLSYGRALVVLASAIYGTNFATIKVLDSELPLSISAALRFTLAAAVVSMIVIGQEDQLRQPQGAANASVAQAQMADPKIVKERSAAFRAGCEIGVYYCAGYIFQAEGLEFVSAGKVCF